MNIPRKLNEIILNLNVKEEEKLLMKQAAEEVLRKIEEVTSTGYPKEIYEAARHLLRRGKLLRGVLVMLINGVYGFNGKEKALRLATAIELLHTASLIHDDIIDGAKTRRGVETVHKRFGLNIAIVSTDLLISIAYNICADLGRRIIEMVSEAGRRMSEAEILECVLEDPTLKDYFTIIEGKSSALIEAACTSSALISKAGRDEVLAFKRYGELIGRILQIRDDILDYVGNEELTGKSNPLIYGLKKINVVDILAKNRGLTLSEAIANADKFGEELAGRASKEILFIEPRKRATFEEFLKFIQERKF